MHPTGFKRKEFRGRLAIAITANLVNRKSEAEARVEEISGVAFIFNQKFFRDLNSATGIDLENIVYYKDETHYFVMTAKKQSLLNKGVIIQVKSNTLSSSHGGLWRHLLRPSFLPSHCAQCDKSATHIKKAPRYCADLLPFQGIVSHCNFCNLLWDNEMFIYFSPPSC